ncbi:hypothetical protein [Luteipulveratus mongoliensis]|uniref:Helix-turn-helix domain-containing protein n=1 Tax=Luteipulveratus mongoliensis TaxID=571913 RepID=A0A0K1JML6_9MICO|nr:hypothetical protein [Luteipulveratus mongoliensis]AKU17959.1 hypothetical protein VV02_22335 [Luteipulveratus mongoliensis]
MEITLDDAATRLGVNQRQAQRLAQTGRLQVVRRVGRSVLVDDESVTSILRGQHSRGRRWTANTAWAAIELLQQGETTRLVGSARSRLKRRLGEVSVEELVRLASDRALTRRYTQTRRTRAALATELALSGVSRLGEDELGVDLDLTRAEGDRVEGYTLAVNELEQRFGLIGDAEGDVLVHATEVPFVIGSVTTALDLIERGLTREKAAATRYLESVL